MWRFLSLQAAPHQVYRWAYEQGDVSTLDALVRLGVPYATWRQADTATHFSDFEHDGEFGALDELAYAVCHSKASLCVASWLVRRGRRVDWPAVHAALEVKSRRGWRPEPALQAWVQAHLGGTQTWAARLRSRGKAGK